MDSDLVLVLGLVLVVLAIPAAMSAFSDGRRPIAPAATLVIAVCLIAFAHVSHPGGYAVRDVPGVFYSVVGRVLR